MTSGRPATSRSAAPGAARSADQQSAAPSQPAGASGSHEVDQAELADLGVVVQPSVADHPGNELPADHPGRADHGDVHALTCPVILDR